MDTRKINKILKPYLTPQNILIFVVIIAIFLILGIIFFQRLFPGKEGTITENQIRIQKGDKVVLVDRNGLVEYRTKDGVFYEVWDGAKISNFFALMEQEARRYLQNPNPQICNQGYIVTLYLDGKEVTVCLENEEVIDEVFENFGDDTGDDLGDIFDDLFPGDEGGGEVTPTPTPIPTTLIVSGQDDGDSGGGGDDQVEIVECALYQEQVTTRTIISNTLCVAAVSPTPTPTP